MDSITITFNSDEKGYFDRKCPNPNCSYTFKIYMQDWEKKVSDEEVHCPMCGHIDKSDKWWTEEQLESIKRIGESYALSEIQKLLDKSFGRIAHSTRNNKYVKLTYKPGRRITFQNNPIGQREEWETEITCEKCGTRYSVIGSAYFCPCCGNNSAVSAFDESMDTIKKMIDSLPEMKKLLTECYDLDKADTMCRSMMEDSIGKIVSAFQKYASCLYDDLTGKKSKVNDFQIVEKGSKLFKDATGKGYEEWLSAAEIQTMNMMFQRRHILEHNNGMIDQKYIDNSGDLSYVIGQRLVVKESDTFSLLSIVKKLGKCMLSMKEAPTT